MPAPTKTTISFSLISIPIALYRATRNHDIRFHQLHREDQQRIRYKKVCSHCGEEVKASDIVRGYQYDEDHFVVITDEDIEKIRTEKDKTIQILQPKKLFEMAILVYSV